MTSCKKLYYISELLNDDLSLVATALKLCQIKDDHKVVLKNITNQDIEKYSSSIDIIYAVIIDNYNIDGVISIIESIHKSIPHNIDMVRSNVDSGIIVGDDAVKGEQLNLFYMEDTNA